MNNNTDNTNETRKNEGSMNMDRKPGMQHSNEVASNSSDVDSTINPDNPEVHQTQSFTPANSGAKDPATTTNRLDKEIDSKVSENRPSNVGITSNEGLNGK